MRTVITDTSGLVENPCAGAMAVTVPRTQQAAAVHPSGSQGEASSLLHVPLVVENSNIVPGSPACQWHHSMPDEISRLRWVGFSSWLAKD